MREIVKLVVSYKNRLRHVPGLLIHSMSWSERVQVWWPIES